MRLYHAFSRLLVSLSFAGLSPYSYEALFRAARRVVMGLKSFENEEVRAGGIVEEASVVVGAAENS